MSTMEPPTGNQPYFTLGTPLRQAPGLQVGFFLGKTNYVSGKTSCFFFFPPCGGSVLSWLVEERGGKRQKPKRGDNSGEVASAISCTRSGWWFGARWMDKIILAPPKKLWIDDSLANTYKTSATFPMLSRDPSFQETITNPGKQLVSENNYGWKEWKRNQPLEQSMVSHMFLEKRTSIASIASIRSRRLESSRLLHAGLEVPLGFQMLLLAERAARDLRSVPRGPNRKHPALLWTAAKSIQRSTVQKPKGMIQCPCKCQQTMGFPWLELGAGLRPSTVWPCLWYFADGVGTRNRWVPLV